MTRTIKTTRVVTINHLYEITIPWKPGPARDAALARRDYIAGQGLPYTYEVVEERVDLDSIKLDLP